MSRQKQQKRNPLLNRPVSQPTQTRDRLEVFSRGAIKANSVGSPLADNADRLLAKHRERVAHNEASMRRHAERAGENALMPDVVARQLRELKAKNILGDNKMPMILVADAHSCLSAALKANPHDQGIKMARAYVYNKWAADASGSMTIKDVHYIRSHFMDQFPRSKLASVVERDFTKVGFNTLNVKALYRLASQIYDQSSYEAVVVANGLDGNKPDQIRARALLRGVAELRAEEQKVASGVPTTDGEGAWNRAAARLQAGDDPTVNKLSQYNPYEEDDDRNIDDDYNEDDLNDYLQFLNDRGDLNPEDVAFPEGEGYQVENPTETAPMKQGQFDAFDGPLMGDPPPSGESGPSPDEIMDTEEEIPHDESSEEISSIESPYTGDELVVELGTELGEAEMPEEPPMEEGPAEPLMSLGQLDDLTVDDQGPMEMGEPMEEPPMEDKTEPTSTMMTDPSSGQELEVTLTPIENSDEMTDESGEGMEFDGATARSREKRLLQKIRKMLRHRGFVAQNSAAKKTYNVWVVNDGNRSVEPLDSFKAHNFAAALMRSATLAKQAGVRGEVHANSREALILLEQGGYLHIQAEGPEVGSEFHPKVEDQQPDQMAIDEGQGGEVLTGDQSHKQNRPNLKVPHVSKDAALKIMASKGITPASIESQIFDGKIVSIAGWNLKLTDDLDIIQWKTGAKSGKAASMQHLDRAIGDWMCFVATELAKAAYPGEDDKDDEDDDKDDYMACYSAYMQEKQTGKCPADIEKNADAPPGWESTVKDMKKHKEIDNPFALAWWMKNKGYTPGGKSGSLKASYFPVFTLECPNCKTANTYDFPKEAMDMGCGCGEVIKIAQIEDYFERMERSAQRYQEFVVNMDVPPGRDRGETKINAKRMLQSIQRIVPQAEATNMDMGKTKKDPEGQPIATPGNMEIYLRGEIDDSSLRKVEKVLRDKFGIQQFDSKRYAEDDCDDDGDEHAMDKDSQDAPNIPVPATPPMPAMGNKQAQAQHDSGHAWGPSSEVDQPGIQKEDPVVVDPTTEVADNVPEPHTASLFEIEYIEGKRAKKMKVRAHTQFGARKVFRKHSKADITKIAQLEAPMPTAPVPDAMPVPDNVAPPAIPEELLQTERSVGPEEAESIKSALNHYRHEGLGPAEAIAQFMKDYEEENYEQAAIIKLTGDVFTKPQSVEGKKQADGGPLTTTGPAVNTQQPDTTQVDNNLGPDSETNSEVEEPSKINQQVPAQSQSGTSDDAGDLGPDSETRADIDTPSGKIKPQHPVSDQQGTSDSVTPDNLGKDTQHGENKSTKDMQSVSDKADTEALMSK